MRSVALSKLTETELDNTSSSAGDRSSDSSTEDEFLRTKTVVEKVVDCCERDAESFKDGGSRFSLGRMFWAHYKDNPKPNMFQDIHVVCDGGLADVSKLLRPYKYFYAGQIVAYTFLNSAFIISQDYPCVFTGNCVGTATDEKAFLLSRRLISDKVPGEKLIFAFELGLLAVLIGRIVRLTITSVCAPKSSMTRWVTASHLFFDVLPNIPSYSAMQLLYRVKPAIIATDAYGILVSTSERMEVIRDSAERRSLSRMGFCQAALWSTLPLLSYVLSLTICFIIGVDAFMVKLRLASRNIDEPNMALGSMIRVLLFLFQVLGVVNLTWFGIERLELFVFGSEYGEMRNKEIARRKVWNAILTRCIYEEYNFFNFLVVMLTFDDYDFQMLVLDEAPERKIQDEEDAVLKSLRKEDFQLLTCYERWTLRHIMDYVD